MVANSCLKRKYISFCWLPMSKGQFSKLVSPLWETWSWALTSPATRNTDCFAFDLSETRSERGWRGKIGALPEALLAKRNGRNEHRVLLNIICCASADSSLSVLGNVLKSRD